MPTDAKDRRFSCQKGTLACRWIGIVLLILFLFVGVIYANILAPVPRFTDEMEYLALSANLIHGPGFSIDGIHLTAARSPGEAFFLAALRLIGGGFVTFRVAQFALLGGTIILITRLMSESRMPAGLFIVTALVACYPILFFTAATLYPQTLAAFLFMLSLFLMLKSPRGILLNAGTGISFGLLILVTPTFLPTMLVVLATACMLRMMRRRDALTMIVAAVMMVGTWTVRNALSLDHFVPVATNSGLNLLEGNNENATADAAANVGMTPYYVQAGNLRLDEFQCDTFYRDAALTWMSTHPVKASILYLRKVLNFFSPFNSYSLESKPEVEGWRQVVLAVGYILLLGLAGARLFAIRRFPLLPREKLFIAIYVLSAFTSAIFFTRIRHRLPYDYLLIAFVAAHLSRCLESRLFSIQTSAAL